MSVKALTNKLKELSKTRRYRTLAGWQEEVNERGSSNLKRLLRVLSAQVTIKDVIFEEDTDEESLLSVTIIFKGKSDEPHAAELGLSATSLSAIGKALVAYGFEDAQLCRGKIRDLLELSLFDEHLGMSGTSDKE